MRAERPKRLLWLALGCVVATVFATACVIPPPTTVGSTSAIDAPKPLDCTNWRYGPADEPAPGVLPAEYDRNNYKRTSLRDPRPELANSPQNQCGQKGDAVDLAWGVTKGRDDVLISVLDSGIMWRDAGRMADLARAAYINIGEARPPCAAPVQGSTPRSASPPLGSTVVSSGDCNHDGVFDIADFGPIPDRNGNGVADPEDLILDPKYSNGRDDDHNGYVDDISGWDFLYGDNDPLDTVTYGHGSGEAEDSTARENGTGDVGNCPKCRLLPIRVSDSFIAEGGRFAAGVMFALDSGADVVQEALGALTNPAVTQQAIDAAYKRGVVVVASMADEASKHPNLPASLEHTMAVNSVTTKDDPVTGANSGYLALNGCTNFGGHTFVSVESGSCSSEATGQMSGMVGLLESEARDAHIQPPNGLRWYRNGASNVLSANETMQIVRSTADDVDFARPNAVDPANNFGTPTGGIIDTVRYPTTPGWDATFGFGRVNAYEMVKAVRAGRIPPEVDITGPSWFDVLPTSGKLRVTGRVAADRARSYDYRVEWATGLQPPAYPGHDTWHVVAARHDQRVARSGTLAEIDLAQIAAALPNGGKGAPVDPSGKPDEERFSVRLRVVVTAHGGHTEGLQGVSQKQVFVHDDPDLVRGFPTRLKGAGTSQPVFANLDSKPGDEMIVATDDGFVHAYDSRGRDIRGWPVRTMDAPWWPTGSPTARFEHIRPPGSAISFGAPVVADLDGDGQLEVVVTDTDGNVWVWQADGQRRSGFTPVMVDGHLRSPAHVNAAFSTDSTATQDEFNRTKRGFAGAPAVADLDGDGQLDIVAAALDRHVYAFDDDGAPLPGFPVLAVDPAKVQSVDPVSHKVTFLPDSGVRQGGELFATPTLVDLTGDGRPEIVVGAQEEYQESPNIGDGASVLGLLQNVTDLGNTRLYAISSRGTNATFPDRSAAHPDDQAYLPGWPVALGQLGLEVLPTIGDGVATQVAAGDVNPHPGVEIIAASAAGPPYVLDAQGKSVYGQVNGKDVPAAWTAGLFGETAARFGAQRSSNDIITAAPAFTGFSIGQLDDDATRPEFAAPTLGFSRLLDIQASDLQLPNDDQVMGWNGTTGNALPGFPQVSSDMAFFVTPAIADLAGNGVNDVISGNGVYMLNAFDQHGTRPAGWPKLTGGWLVGTPGLGDWNGDGKAEIATVRRDGVLMVWHTNAPAASLTEWRRYGGNNRNTGVYHDR